MCCIVWQISNKRKFTNSYAKKLAYNFKKRAKNLT